MSDDKEVATVSSDQQPGEAEHPPDRVLLSWSTLPAADRPLVASIVGLFVLILAFLVHLWTDSWFFTGLTALVMWGSLSQFYVRTKFTFTEQKVKVRYVVNKLEKEWAQYRSYYVDKNGVLLSPFLRPSRLENFRGLYVRFSNNRDEVLNIVKQRIVVPEDDLDEI